MNNAIREPGGGDFAGKLRFLVPELIDSTTAYFKADESETANCRDQLETECRNRIVEAAQAIVDAARPPQPEWMNKSTAGAEFVALRLFIEWGAFEIIPVEGSISYRELAQKTGADEQLVSE